MNFGLFGFGLTATALVGERLGRLQADFIKAADLQRTDLGKLVWLVPALAALEANRLCMRLSIFCQRRLLGFTR